MNSYIQLGLDLGLLEKIEINLGNQKFTGYGILKVEDKVYENLVKEISDGKYNHTLPTKPISAEIAKIPITDLWKYAPGGEKDIREDGFVPVKEAVSEVPIIQTSPIPTAEQLEAQQALARMTGDAPVAEKKKRGRPKKETFTLTEPEVPKAEPATAPVTPEPPTISNESASVPSTDGKSKTLDEWQTPVVEPIAPQPLAEPEFEGKPTADQAREFRLRLTHFADDCLPAAGLVPSQGIGGVRAKIKLFIKSKYGVEDTKLLTVDKWAELLALLEKTEASEMVKLINQEIGA